MIKIFAGLYLTPVSNHLLLMAHIMKVLNPHTPSKEELLLVMFERDLLEVFGECFVKIF